MIAAWVRLILGQRRWLVPLCLAVFVGAVWQARDMPVQHNPFKVFASDSPEVDYLEDFFAIYGQDTNFVYVLAEPHDGEIFDAATLAELRELSEALQHVPRVADVQGLATAERLVVSAGALEAVPVVPPGPLDAAAAASAATVVAETPVLRRALLNDAGTVTPIMVRFDEGMISYEDYAEPLVAFDAVLATHGAGLKLTPVGVPLVQRGYVQLIRGDQRRFMPFVVGMLLLVLLFLFRSTSGTLLPLASVGMSAACAVAIMHMTGESFNIISFTIPTLVLVIGIADAIHLVERYLEERRHGHAVEPAIHRASTAIGQALVLTSMTTAIGFASLWLAEIHTIAEFGLWAAVAIMVAFVVTLTVVPLWLATWNVPLKGYESHETSDVVDRALAGTAHWVVRRPWTVLGAWVVALVVAGIGIGRIERDSTLLEELFDDHPLVHAQHYAEGAGFAVLPVEVDLQAPPGAFKDPAVLREVVGLQQWLEDQPTVARAASFADLAQELHRAFEGEAGLYEDPVAMGQALFLFEALGNGALDRWVTPDYGRMHVQGMRYDRGLNAYRALYANLDAELQRRFAGSDVQWHITGSSRIATNAVDAIVRDLFRSLGLAFAIIAVIMTLLFRNLRVGLLSMVPNLLPLIVAGAVMGFLGFHVRISSGIIYSVALGIAVDDTIHFLSRFRAERRAGADPATAIVATARTAGRGIVWTSVVLVAGFSVLMMSGFRGIHEFGLLMGVSMGAAVLADLTLLPALLIVAKPFRAED